MHLVVKHQLTGEPLVHFSWERGYTTLEWAEHGWANLMYGWAEDGVEKFEVVHETCSCGAPHHLRSLGVVPSTSAEFLPTLKAYMNRRFPLLDVTLTEDLTEALDLLG